ncbi:MAG: hypothetical protein JNK74_04505 [Candidatus Hydrogenedentes bacterium]|nr:hypothetical protein [Candidatus Hydrogenedentota bacterium]
MTPLLQWLLWRIDKRWAALPIAGLTFVPAWSWLTLSFGYQSGNLLAKERWALADLVTGSHAWAAGTDMTIASFMGFLLWKIVSRFPGKNFRGETVQPLPVGKFFLALLVLLWGVCVLLSGYKSLQYAVESGDEELAARRLAFNLEGVGPADGRIREIGGGRFTQSSLLPLAVEMNNKAMVKLLVEYGADLNPVGANDLFGAEISLTARQVLLAKPQEYSDETLKTLTRLNVISRNSVAAAIDDDNAGMLEYLLSLGANPTQGLFSAVVLDKPELFKYLVRHGANVDVVREELKSVGKDVVLYRMFEKVEKQTIQ